MERRQRWGRNLLMGAGFVAVSVVATAQSAAPPGQSTVQEPTPVVSRSLGLFAYPREGQPATRQIQDEAACFTWARTQTGIDPLALPNADAQQPPAAGAKANAVERSPAKDAAAGAAGGAVAGTAIGAVAGDPGKGAAIGATGGLLRRAREGRKAAQEAERKAAADAAGQAQAAARAQAASEQRRETFNRAFGACMDGRGYTVK